MQTAEHTEHTNVAYMFGTGPADSRDEPMVTSGDKISFVSVNLFLLNLFCITVFA